MNTQSLDNDITRICKNRGVKLTEKRRRVLSVLLNEEMPVSPYELAEKYTEIFGEKIPAMSVYRILDFFAEEGIVHKIFSANKYVSCSHLTCDHEHQILQFLICRQCQSVSEIPLSKTTLDSLKSHIEKTGFLMDEQQLEIRGVCKACQAKA
ncbi:MAG: Fur family transcriptional regulator [Cellvibrionales bacterium]|nr:Fur family transcriptional regulator [Cellvibrionales bacterium]